MSCEGIIERRAAGAYSTWLNPRRSVYQTSQTRGLQWSQLCFFWCPAPHRCICRLAHVFFLRWPNCAFFVDIVDTYRHCRHIYRLIDLIGLAFHLYRLWWGPMETATGRWHVPGCCCYCCCCCYCHCWCCWDTDVLDVVVIVVAIS